MVGYEFNILFKINFSFFCKIVLEIICDSGSYKDLHVFIMSGTNDSICGTVSTQEWIEELDIKPIKKWKQYFVDKEPAGYLNTYRANNKKRFLFATVNGAGHEIPMYKNQ